MGKTYCRRGHHAAILLTAFALCWAIAPDTLRANSITPTSVKQTQDDDAQAQLLALFGIGSSGNLVSQTLSVQMPDGLEAYASYFPISIFSGSLNTWKVASTPQQVLISNFLSSNQQKLFRTEEDDDGLSELKKLLTNSFSDDQTYAKAGTISGLTSSSTVLSTQPGSLQTSVTVATPEPSTLVLFGCATVALSLGLANRSVKKDMEPVVDTVDPGIWPRDPS